MAAHAMRRGSESKFTDSNYVESLMLILEDCTESNGRYLMNGDSG